MDVNDLPEQLKKAAAGGTNISLGYRFLRQAKELVFTVEKIQPEIIVRNNIFLEITEEKMNVVSLTDYTITKAGVFNFKLAVPADMEVIDISGADIENWKVSDAKESGRGSIRNIEVQLRSKAMGAYRLSVAMEKPINNLLDDAVMPEITVVDADKVSGYIGVSGESSIRLKTKQKSKLTEVSLGELVAAPAGISAVPALAYKFVSQPYALQLGAEKVDPRLTAEVFTLVSISH